MYRKLSFAITLMTMILLAVGGSSLCQEKENLTELSLTADVFPQRTVNVIPKVNGTLKEVRVKLGDEVKEGEVIARIDEREYLLGVKQAEAALLSAKASYEKASSILEMQAEANLHQAQAAFAAAEAQLNLTKSTAYVEFISNLEQAKASLKMAQAQLEKVRKGARKEEIERAEAAYEQALASFQNAEKDLKRARDNYEKGAISDQQFDKAQLQFKVAQAQLRSAKANLELVRQGATEEDMRVVEAQVEQAQARLKALEAMKEAKSWQAKVESTKAQWQNAYSNLKLAKKSYEDRNYEKDLELAKAQVDQAEAALELARIRLENCTIKAPFSGVVSKCFVDEGNLVGPGQVLFTIVDIDRVKLVTHVSYEDLEKVKAAQLVTLEEGSYLNKTFKIKEINVSPVVDPLSRKIELQIVIPNPDHLVKPGMFPRIKLWRKDKEQG